MIMTLMLSILLILLLYDLRHRTIFPWNHRPLHTLPNHELELEKIPTHNYSPICLPPQRLAGNLLPSPSSHYKTVPPNNNAFWNWCRRARMSFSLVPLGSGNPLFWRRFANCFNLKEENNLSTFSSLHQRVPPLFPFYRL